MGTKWSLDTCGCVLGYDSNFKWIKTYTVCSLHNKFSGQQLLDEVIKHRREINKKTNTEFPEGILEEEKRAELIPDKEILDKVDDKIKNKDYFEGANFCRTNSNRLETSARIILNDSDGTDSFGLFLYYIAHEEMAKAVFCLFVERGWVKEDFVTKIFKDHKPKIFLFEEIFRSFEVINSEGYLGGKKLGEIPLDKFVEDHNKNILEQRQTTNDFLYVKKTDDWKVPEFEISDIKEKEEKIKLKTIALDTIFEYIREKHYDNSHNVNFKFYEDKEGNFGIKWDSI